jgi:hypothetical protein
MPSKLNSLDSLVLCKIVRILPPKTGAAFASIDKNSRNVLREEIKTIRLAVRLQRFWRFRRVCHSTRNILSSFLETTALTPGDLRAMSFDALCLHLRKSAQVIKPFRRLLMRINSVAHRILSDQELEGAFQAPERHNVRFFLGAYMISCHPDNTIDPAHPLAASLWVAARDFIQCFDKVVAKLSSARGSFQGFPREMMLEFMHACSLYIHVFGAWKEEDAHALVRRIYAALLTLAEARMAVLVNDPSPGDHLLAEIDAQTLRLREKLINMGEGRVLEVYDRFTEDLAGQVMFVTLNPELVEPDVVNPEEDQDDELLSNDDELNGGGRDDNEELNPEDEELSPEDDDEEELNPEDDEEEELSPEDAALVALLFA